MLLHHILWPYSAPHLGTLGPKYLYGYLDPLGEGNRGPRGSKYPIFEDSGPKKSYPKWYLGPNALNVLSGLGE